MMMKKIILLMLLISIFESNSNEKSHEKSFISIKYHSPDGFNADYL